MGGHIWAVSTKGAGSTFHFSIELPVASAPHDVPRAEPHLRGRSILVVDDHPVNRRILEVLLGSRGASVTSCADATSGLEHALSGQFDVAILDLQMPGLDGLGLARAIRGHGRMLPLILLSSIGDAIGDVDSGPSAREFVARLSKPVRPSALLTALAACIPDTGGRDPAGPVAAAPGPFADPATRLRILLAEDNVINQQVAVKMLQRLGHQTDVVANGAEAVDAVRRQRYDVVFMDVQMPEMDGLEATRHLRAAFPDGGPRIIAMTANALAEDRDACLAAGMDGYVAKPITLAGLHAALDTWSRH
jgi:CheY-like chemotaxis protein